MWKSKRGKKLQAEKEKIHYVEYDYKRERVCGYLKTLYIYIVRKQ